MKTLLTPAPALSRRTAAIGVSLLLAVSAVCLALAPLLMPADYGWVTHSRFGCGHGHPAHHGGPA